MDIGALIAGGSAFPSSMTTQASGFWGNLGQVLGGIAGGLGSGGMGLALPGGTDIDLPGADLWPGDPMQRGLWTQGSGRFRQLPELVVPSPDGRIGVWKAAGRPVLYSGDLAACRRVNRVASRVARVARRRGGSVRRRRGGR